MSAVEIDNKSLMPFTYGNAVRDLGKRVVVVALYILTDRKGEIERERERDIKIVSLISQFTATLHDK